MAPPAAQQKKNERPQLKSAAGSYANMPPVSLLCHYLDDDQRRGFVDSMAEVKVGQNEVIMRQGDKGNNFYLIKSGTCDVWIADKDGERKNVRSLSAGSWCGELSLLHLKTRSASIMATSSEVTLLMVNRKTFQASIGDLITKKRGELLPFLTKLSIFADMDEYEMGMLADAAKVMNFKAGDTIHEKDKPSDNRFYLVREGKITTPGITANTYGKQSYFGHIELLQSSMNSETRRASDATTCVTFKKEDFMKLVPLHAFVREAGQQQLALASSGAGGKMRGRRFGESAEATQTTVGKPAGAIAKGTKKSPEAVKRIMAAVKSNIIFSRLNEMQLTMLQQAMMEHSVEAGENVITQGE